MILVIILSQMKQKLQQSDQSIKRKVATKLRIIRPAKIDMKDEEPRHF